MKSEIKVMMSDGVNKYRQLTPTDVLEEGFREFFRKGMPTHLGHDLTIPIGWTTGLALYLEPSHGYAVGRVDYCESEDEFRDVAIRAQNHFYSQALADYEKHKEKFQKILGAHLTGKETPVHLECCAINETGLAKRVFPHLFEKVDKDGLVSLDELTPLGQGVYKIGELCVFAHPYLRRSGYILNTLNYPFLKMFDSLKENGEVVSKIAIDEDSVGLASTYKTRMELQYWWGPKFNEDLTNIPNGVTVHAADDTQKRFTGVVKTEFGWYDQDGKRAFECEEVTKRQAYAIEGKKWACRFVHSMVNLNSKLPDHLDGAIRLYTAEQIEQRQEVDIKNTSRNMEYKKLWRVDGPIPIPVWKGLISHFYRDNELPMEYLGVDLSEERKQFEKEQETEPKHPLLPPRPFKSGNGIRIALSYSEKPSDPSAEVFVISPTTLGNVDGVSWVIEIESLEFIKAIRRSGLAVRIQDGVRFVKYNNDVLNAPIIVLDGNDSKAKYLNCLHAIEKVLEKRDAIGDFKMVVLNFRIEYESLCANVSVAGNSDDVRAWIDSGVAELPSQEKGLSDWTAKNKQWMGTNTKSFDGADIYPLLKKNGFLYIDRTFLEQDTYKVKVEGSELVLEYEIPEEIQTEFSSKHDINFSAFIDEFSCSKCGLAYLTCECSAYLDEGVRVAFESFVPVGVHIGWKRTGSPLD